MSLEATSESSDCSISECSHRASDLCFEYHSNTDTFSVKDIRSHDCLDSVSDSVTEVDEVAKTGFLLVDRNDVSLGSDRASNDGEEEGLSR